jgi:hypothetical protein
MITDDYEKLHAQYIQAVVEYHNIYVKYIKGRLARKDYPKMRAALKQLKTLNTQMTRTLTILGKAKKESNFDKYQEQRTRNKKNVNNNSTD